MADCPWAARTIARNGEAIYQILAEKVTLPL
jgi:hypothetical protein